MEESISRAIGYFYYHKNNRNEDAAIKEIEELRISNIIYENDKVTITLSRPGFIIGKGGKNLNELAAYLRKEINSNIKIEIKEDKILYHLYDFDVRYIGGCINF